MAEPHEVDDKVVRDSGSHIAIILEDEGPAIKQLIKEIKARQDLVLLDDTNVNACLFQYVPSECRDIHSAPTLSLSDLEKIDELNLWIRRNFINGEHIYLHGLKLEGSKHDIHPKNHPIYGLAAVLASPQIATTDVTAFLERVAACGRNMILERGYKILRPVVRLDETDECYSFKQHKPRIEEVPTFRKLSREISKFFGSVPHVSLVYGSTTGGGNMLLSNVNVMAFAKDDFCTPDKVAEFKQLFLDIMAEEGISLNCWDSWSYWNSRNDDISILEKLLVPLSTVQAAAETRCQLKKSKVVSMFRYTPENESLFRLIFNILTVPTIVLSGDVGCLRSARTDAEAGLFKMITTITGQKPSNPKDFISAAMTDGTRTGEDYLGYKDRPDVREYLGKIFDNQTSRATPTQLPAQPVPPTVIEQALPAIVAQVVPKESPAKPKPLLATHNPLLVKALAQGSEDGYTTSNQNALTEQTPCRVPSSSTDAALIEATCDRNTDSSIATHHINPPHSPFVKSQLAMQTAPKIINNTAPIAIMHQNPKITSNTSSTFASSTLPCVIFLNGPLGIRRRNIAENLKLMLSNARVLDDTKLIYIAQEIEPDLSTNHHALRKTLRKVAIDHFKSAACEGTTIIIPYHAPSSSPDTIEVLLEYLDIARCRQIPFVSLQMLCSEEARLAHLRRTAEHHNAWPSTVTDAKVLQQLRDRERHMGNTRQKIEVEGVDVTNCQLDTTGLNLKKAASMIVRLLPRAAPFDLRSGAAVDIGPTMGTAGVERDGAAAENSTVVANSTDMKSSEVLVMGLAPQ
ncbi:hypothetical protein MMC11_005889 [Xylographa trunciseda]|nr:hypothetical protein [Xylographa trunciseda]